MKYRILPVLLLGISCMNAAISQEDTAQEIEQLKNQISNLRHTYDRMQKSIDDLLMFERVGDVAFIDKVRLTGPPKPDRVEKNKDRQGYGNPLQFQAYMFIPKDIDPSRKYPLLVLPHGGVHSNFNTFYAHIIRELMAQQYIVVAAEYRGSTGYGKGFYESIDYGGLEVEDVYASRNYAVENYEIVDSNRVGIFGWSHGGLITLFNIFNHPSFGVPDRSAYDGDADVEPPLPTAGQIDSTLSKSREIQFALKILF